MTDLGAILSNERLRLTLAVRDWLVGEARDIADPNVIIEGLSLKLRDAGVPIDQAISAVEFRHAERAANARIWEFGSPAREHIFGHERGSEATGRRPLAEAHRLREWIFSWLPDLPDDTYDIVPELKAAGYTHHIAVPVVLPNGMHNGFTFATRAPNGFSDEDIAVLRSIVPTLAALQEILALRRVMREVMRMYVGNEPHLRILSGDVRRGEVLRIRAAILFADMRDFTGLTAHLPEEAATALVNDYYDCIVPPIDERGGEVLKFLGDGILAIFRTGEDAESEACLRAFAAARAGLLRVARHNAASNICFEVGIALHFGNAAFGNVGSGARLDYTVIGSDVNLASRIADLCGELGEGLLLSDAFQRRLSEQELRRLGAFPLKGVDEAQAVFAPVGP
ncbi:MAG: adenylate/guanylate cyclase domain-containing protein [Methyloceanibacter sp.]|nr:adenylate/guanylate cyclase domain-containing protein [Methyloceanibacter sp.]